MPRLKRPGRILPFGLPVGFNVRTAPGALRLKGCKTYGMFTFKTSASFPWRSESAYGQSVPPMTLTPLGSSGIKEWRLASFERNVEADHSVQVISAPKAEVDYLCTAEDWREEAGAETVFITLIMQTRLMSPTRCFSSTHLFPPFCASAADSNQSVTSSRVSSSFKSVCNILKSIKQNQISL